MARRIITTLVSDLSGEPADADAGETVEFAYRGTSYTIDLTSSEAAAFDQAMGPYLAHATKLTTRRPARQAAPKNRSSATSTDSQRIRTWARENGYEVSDRGRVKAEIAEAFQAARKP